MSAPSPVWFSVNEAAAHARVRGCTIRRAIRAGKLHAFRLADVPKGRIRLRLEDVERWMTAQPIVAKGGA